MPNGRQRWADEKQCIIDPMEKSGWEYVTEEEAPNWVLRRMPEAIQRHSGREYKYVDYHADRHVFRITSSVHGSSVHIFRILKSDYHETTPEEGTCPNCQAYVRRFDGDEYLTCHRCGWQYKPVKERISRVVARWLPGV